MSRRFLLIFLPFFMALHAEPLPQNVSRSDQIVAVVDQQIITREEWRQAHDARVAASEQGWQDPMQTLKGLIARRALLKAAQFSSQAKDPRPKLKENDSLGLSTAESLGFREEKAFGELRRNWIQPLLPSPGQEAAETAELKKHHYQYELSHVLLSPDHLPQEHARRFHLISQAFRLSQPVSEIAQNWSDAFDAQTGGYLGWRTYAQLPSVFAEVVPRLKIGECQGPLVEGENRRWVCLLNQQSNWQPEWVDEVQWIWLTNLETHPNQTQWDAGLGQTTWCDNDWQSFEQVPEALRDLLVQAPTHLWQMGHRPGEWFQIVARRTRDRAEDQLKRQAIDHYIWRQGGQKVLEKEEQKLLEQAYVHFPQGAIANLPLEWSP